MESPSPQKLFEFFSKTPLEILAEVLKRANNCEIRIGEDSKVYFDTEYWVNSVVEVYVRRRVKHDDDVINIVATTEKLTLDIEYNVTRNELRYSITSVNTCYCEG